MTHMTAREWPFLGGASQCRMFDPQTGEPQRPSDATALLPVIGLLVSIGHILILWNQTQRAQQKANDVWEIHPWFFFIVGVLSHAFGLFVLFVRYRKCQASQGLVWYLVFASLAWGMELILRHKPRPL